MRQVFLAYSTNLFVQSFLHIHKLTLLLYCVIYLQCLEWFLEHDNEVY